MPAEQRKTLTLDIADMAERLLPGRDRRQRRGRRKNRLADPLGLYHRSRSLLLDGRRPGRSRRRRGHRAAAATATQYEPGDLSDLFRHAGRCRRISSSRWAASSAPRLRHTTVLTPGAGWTPDYVAALVYNGCQMSPDAYYLGMIGRAVRAVSRGPPRAQRRPSGKPRTAS